MLKFKMLMRNNLWNAVEDYRCQTYETDVLDDITSDFINRLADDAIESKSELRELFRKSQGWDESLQAIIINGTKTHNPDYVLVNNLANTILAPARLDATAETRFLIDPQLDSSLGQTTRIPTLSTPFNDLLQMPTRLAKNAAEFSKPCATR